MILTEEYLRALLHARENQLLEDTESECMLPEDIIEYTVIEDVLNGRDTITIADDSIIEYFKPNSIIIL